MKTIDDSTLEAVAELICGYASGIGAEYSTPGYYRSMGEIRAFFERAGVMPQGESGTRKWFALESLKSVNGSYDLERVLLRIISPMEYSKNYSVRQAVEDHLNTLLQVEGLEVVLLGVKPVLRERTASIPTGEERLVQEEVPDFYQLVQDDSLAEVLSFRWEEAQKCVAAEAFLAAIVMMGSILEGVLLNRFERNKEVGYRAKGAPKDRKTKKPRPIADWGLSNMIDVAHEVGWLQVDIKRFSHALRESRNIVHPYVQRLENDMPDEDTCAICWPVVHAAISDLFRVVE
ncbi:MAG: hypothetical protein OXI16_13375 [Chloroflexota bacterium]|nr:hypothetical protein [Chloroflexota bacterium]